MKKVFLVLAILCSFVTGIFGESFFKDTTLDIDLIVPVSFENYPLGSLNGMQTSVGGAFCTSGMITDIFGLYGNATLSSTVSYRLKDSTTNSSFEVRNQNDYKYSNIILDTFIAAAIKPFNKEKFYIAVNPGLHIKTLYEMSTKSKGFHFFFGLGGNVTGAYKINSKIDIHGKCDVYYDFFHSNKEIKSFIVMPSVGVGIKIK